MIRVPSGSEPDKKRVVAPYFFWFREHFFFAEKAATGHLPIPRWDTGGNLVIGPLSRAVDPELQMYKEKNQYNVFQGYILCKI